MQFEKLRFRAGVMIEVAAALAALATLLAFGGRWWWLLELLTHYRAHYFAGLVVGVACAVVLKHWRLAIAFGVLAAINLTLIVPLYIPPGIDVANARKVRLLVANVHAGNSDHDKFLQLVREASPDAILVLEVSEAWEKSLERLVAEYPNRICRTRTDSFGIALLSRLPADSLEVCEIGPAEVPSIVAKIDCGEGTLLHLVGTHPLPPVSRECAELRNGQLSELSRRAAELPRPTAVAGDLNCTSWSPVFRDFLAASGLVDSRRGFGVQPTWPGKLASIGIAIDHVLVSPDIAVAGRSIGLDIGSDHRPVIVDLRVRRGVEQ